MNEKTESRMVNRYFVKQGIKEAEMEDFIRKNFPLGDYSRTEIVRTPMGTKILIYTNKPGRIIGRGGSNINAITDAVKARFNLENAQVDVKTIENPNLDAKIVAKQIASALERVDPRDCGIELLGERRESGVLRGGGRGGHFSRGVI